ncbi:toll/interleukin-1 receptor domain-containing protein [Candidatus Poribacteria bacterium]
MTGGEQPDREVRLAVLDIQLRKIEESGRGTQYVSFPQKTKNLFEYVKEAASDSPVYKRYEESIEEVWQEWQRDENWADFLKDPEKAKLLAYALYQQAAYSNDNGRKGGVISQFSKQEDYQPNVSRFNKMLLEHFEQALIDILSAETQISEIDRAEDMKSKCIQFFQKLYEMADNDEYKVFLIDDIATALSFGDITTRKVLQYLTGEELVKEVGQQAVRITHKGIVAAVEDLSGQDMSMSLQKEIHSQQNTDPEAQMRETKLSEPHVFVSHVRENQKDVDQLRSELTENGVKVWLDRNDIKVGARWRDAIEEAIQDGAHFIACFSKEYSERDETYMNEELTLAVDRLREFPTDRIWFIPVKLNECEIPKRKISAVETLQDLQWVELYKDWNNGIQRILKVVKPNDGRPSEGYEFELADPARSTTSAFESEFKNFLARLEIEWNDERNSDPINIYEGQRILEDAYQEVLQFRVQIANDEVSEADTILSEAARLLKAIQQHQVYLDGGKSYKAFWEKGDGIIDLLKDAFGVLRQQKID